MNNKEESSQDDIQQKQEASLATYPIAAFLFFVFILAVSIFLHNEELKNAEKSISEESPVKVEQKREELQEVLAKKEKVFKEVVYKPTKKEDFTNLTLENAHAGIILDAESGNILWEKNSTEQKSIASMTKLVTAMVVVDRVRDLDEVVTIPESVRYIEGTKVGCPTSTICDSPRLQVGEKVRIKDLLRAMLVLSANDAATVLGIHVAGSEEEFAKLMNARMKEIGAGNTNFCRPSGLELDDNEESCYSSAYDIARVSAHLLKHEKYDILWDMMKEKEGTFESVDGSIKHKIKSTNRLLKEEDVSNLVGGKTGFTPRAGYCFGLVTSSSDEKHNVISVVLDDKYRFQDTKYMSDWAFDNYIWQ